MKSAPPRFAVAPEQEKLAAVERDLRFRPSPVIDPKLLTREQVAEFNRDGFLKGLRVFGPEEMAGIAVTSTGCSRVSSPPAGRATRSARRISSTGRSTTC